jgi:hypothetical protein
MWMLWMGGLAAAEEAAPPPEAPKVEAPPAADWIPLPPSGVAFPSALTPLGAPPPAAVNPTPAIPTAPKPTTTPAAPLPPAGDLVRSRLSLRPRLARAGLVGGPAGMALGAAVGHQWWQLSDDTLRFAGESRLDLLGRVGDVAGPDLRLTSTHGLWLGPVGLLAGGALRYDALLPDVGGGPGLQAGLSLGPQGRAALDLGPLLPWVAYTPAWVLAGPRSAETLEQTWDGGLDLRGNHVDLRLSGAYRTAADLALWEAGLGLSFHL